MKVLILPTDCEPAWHTQADLFVAGAVFRVALLHKQGMEKGTVCAARQAVLAAAPARPCLPHRT